MGNLSSRQVGGTTADITIQTCWDADRLDLGRVGVFPDAARLCTGAARRLIQWADGRACFRVIPKIVEEEWGIDTDGWEEK
jgi:uncharacterized protein